MCFKTELGYPKSAYYLGVHYFGFLGPSPGPKGFWIYFNSKPGYPKSVYYLGRPIWEFLGPSLSPKGFWIYFTQLGYVGFTCILIQNWDTLNQLTILGRERRTGSHTPQGENLTSGDVLDPISSPWAPWGPHPGEGLELPGNHFGAPFSLPAAGSKGVAFFQPLARIL